MDRKYFGTDGVRGAVGKFPITPEFVLKLGWAAGSVLAKNGKKRVLIGKDTRISGYMLESALEAGLSAAGIKSLLLGPMPTPAVSYLTKAFRADAGVVISASHNPYYDNGIKFFSRQGTKLPDEVEAEIDARLAANDKDDGAKATSGAGAAVAAGGAAGMAASGSKSAPAKPKKNFLDSWLEKKAKLSKQARQEASQAMNDKGTGVTSARKPGASPEAMPSKMESALAPAVLDVPMPDNKPSRQCR